VALGDVDRSIGEGRAAKEPLHASGLEVDQVPLSGERVGGAPGELELLPVALTIVEGDHVQGISLRSQRVGEGNGVHTSGNDGDGLHGLSSSPRLQRKVCRKSARPMT